MIMNVLGGKKTFELFVNKPVLSSQSVSAEKMKLPNVDAALAIST